MSDEREKIVKWLRSPGAEVAEMRRLIIAHEDEAARDVALGVELRFKLAAAIERGAHI